MNDFPAPRMEEAGRILREASRVIDVINREGGGSRGVRLPAAEALFARGVALCLVKDYQAAVTRYSEAISLNPDEARYYLNRGMARRLLGEEENALDDYGRAIVLEPGCPDAYFLRGFIFLARRDLERARADLETAQRLGAGTDRTLREALAVLDSLEK